MNDALEKSSRFHPPADIYELADYASEILSLCNSMGEGWLLTAEMVELIRSGCAERGVHPALRLPAEPRGGQGDHQGAAPPLPGEQHRGRGLRSRVRREVNQLNRIKLMIAVAKANLAEKEAEARAARAVARDGAPEEPEAMAASVEVETTEVVE